MNMMPCLTTAKKLHSVDALTAYLSRVKSIPLISIEEEKELFERFSRNNDLEAARKIVTSHLRFVAYVAKSYSGYGLPLEDIIQEGNLGLMKSVKRFDLSYGVRFATFAIHWIKAEIHEYVLSNWRLVKIATTKAQRKLFFNLRKARKKLAWLTQDEIVEIAKDLKVDSTDVIEMESRLQQEDCFIDEDYNNRINDEDNAGKIRSVYLEDHASRPDTLVEAKEFASESSRLMQKALKGLDQRSHDIVVSRWLAKEKISLKELSIRYEISEERVRQVEQDAMRKIKKILQIELGYKAELLMLA